MNAATKPQTYAQENADTLNQIFYDEAKARLGPGAKLRDVAILAEHIKTLALDPPDPEGTWRDVLAAFAGWSFVWALIMLAIYELSKH